MTADQLRTIVADEVASILPKLADFRRKNEPIETDGMNADTAARFITEQGIPTTRAALYNLVYKEAIPYKKFAKIFISGGIVADAHALLYLRPARAVTDGILSAWGCCSVLFLIGRLAMPLVR